MPEDIASDDAVGYDPAAHADTLAAARANIERIRKRDVVLRLTDRAGRPLAHTPVEVVQKRHAFCFGDQLWHLDRLHRFGRAATDEGRAWTLRFADCLNAANALCYWTERPRNDGPKTEDVQGQPRVDSFLACVDWAAAQGLTVKGHPLCWSIPKCVPEWVKRYDYATRLKFLEVRVRGLIAGVRGKVAIWDVVNEALWEPAFRNLPQRHWPHLEDLDTIADYVQLALRWARDEDPDASYVLNDYGLTNDPADGPPVAANGTQVTAALQRRRLLDLLERLAARGALPNAIGLQSHTGGWLGHDRQWPVYDELAAAGLPIHITEFGATTRHLEAAGVPQDEIDARRADYVANALTCAFGHPAVEAFFFWGFLDQAIRWGPHSSHQLTTLYTRVRGLIHDEWRTRESLTSDGDGTVRFRGFFGRYAVRRALADGTAVGALFRVAPCQSMPLTLRWGSDLD